VHRADDFYVWLVKVKKAFDLSVWKNGKGDIDFQLLRLTFDKVSKNVEPFNPGHGHDNCRRQDTD